MTAPRSGTNIRLRTDDLLFVCGVPHRFSTESDATYRIRRKILVAYGLVMGADLPQQQVWCGGGMPNSRTSPKLVSRCPLKGITAIREGGDIMRVPRLTLLASLGNKRAKPSRHLQSQARKQHRMCTHLKKVSNGRWEMQ